MYKYYQAYISYRPFSNKIKWLKYKSESVEEVRKLVKNNELDWNHIHIKMRCF